MNLLPEGMKSDATLAKLKGFGGHRAPPVTKENAIVEAAQKEEADEMDKEAVADSTTTEEEPPKAEDAAEKKE